MGTWEHTAILERREQGPASPGDPKEPMIRSKSNLVFFISLLTKLYHSSLDVDECQPTNDCMQVCENTVGSYNCKCNADFEVDPSDSKNCIRELHFALIYSPLLHLKWRFIVLIRIHSFIHYSILRISIGSIEGLRTSAQMFYLNSYFYLIHPFVINPSCIS